MDGAPWNTQQNPTFKKDDINLREDTFEPREPQYSLDDMVLSSTLSNRLQAVFSRIENHTTLFDDWGLAQIDRFGKRIAVNLYGPPGTGKTMCAEAMASRFQVPVIEISYAELESKYVGETPKNIVAAFSKARKCGALLLFDEADSILGRRMTDVTQAVDHGVNVSRAVMLRQMDLFSGIIVFCTNLARNYDSAFTRRILYHIKINPPGSKTRLRIWKKLLPKALPGINALNHTILAQRSKGLTGGDIKNAILLASSQAVAREQPKRYVTMSDLKQSIREVVHAKNDVGVALS